MRALACLTAASLSWIGACQGYSNNSTTAYSFTTSSTVANSSSADTTVALGSFILQGLGGSGLSTTTLSETHSLVSSTHPSNALLTSFASNATASPALSDDWESAKSCNSASVSWRRAHAYSGTDTWSTSTWVTTIINETTINPTNTAPTTLCDGYPRIEGSVTSYTNTYVTTSSTKIYGSASAVCQTDCPDCTINSEACSKIWSSWAAYTSSNSSDISRAYSTPACPSPTPTSTATYDSYCHRGKVPCTFTAGPVRLMYFPVEVKGDRLCGNYSTVSPPSNLSGPVTAEAYSTTFTSGTAYISFESLRAYDGCGEATGTAMSNFFLPLPSADVSSMCGSDGGVFASGPTSTLLNFADLNYPIATNVYKCQAKCLWGVDVAGIWKMRCATIYDDYKPVLAYPTQVQQLQPNWNQCWFNPDTYLRYQEAQEYYLFDPPVALTPAASEALPTLSAQPAHKTSTPAQQTSATTSNLESEHSGEAPLSPVPDSKPTSTEGNPPNTNDPGQPQVNHPSSAPNAEPDNAGKTSGSVPLPAGLSVLSEALSKAIETARPATETPVAPANDPERHDQNTAPTSPENIVTVLSAASTPAAMVVSRSGSNYVVDGQTVGPGSAVTVSGQVISAAPDGGNGLVLGPSSTIMLADGRATTIAMTPQEPATVAHDGSAYIVAGTILTAGQAATVNGQALSVLLSGTGVVVDGKTLHAVDSGALTTGITISRTASDYVINGQTVTASGTANVNGMMATLLPNEGGLLMGTSTISLSTGSVTVVTATGSSVAGLEISRAGSDFIVDGQTLIHGQVATVDGMLLSALSTGAGIVIGTSTISLAPGAATTLGPTERVSDLEITRSGSIVIVEGHTLTAGQTAIIDGEHISVLGSAAGVVVGSRTTSLAVDASATIQIDGEATMAPSAMHSGVTTTPYSVATSTGVSFGGTAAVSQSGATGCYICYEMIVLANLILQPWRW